MREAQYYKSVGDGKVRCELCPHNCLIPDGKAGICRFRRNRNGKLYSEIYGKVAAVAVDPMEKKPLYHFYPGSEILSFGTLGCSFSCPFCQNWHISQGIEPTQEISPQDAVSLAQKYGVSSIAYTYSEPLTWYEYVYDTSKLARRYGIHNVLVTNGYINETPLRELLRYTDALNIDVKAFTEGFYKRLCKGSLEPVKRAVEISKRAGAWVEVTNLIIPTLNDGDEEIRSMVDWLAGVDPTIPLHFSRYHPAYKMDIVATPMSTLERAYAIAKEKLRYVYVGNVIDDRYNSTHCYNCGEIVIERSGYHTRVKLSDKKCPKCRSVIDIII
ncbi:MAG: AmmeMemoRadiSam system radical SAM enzyme [bacterium]